MKRKRFLIFIEGANPATLRCRETLELALTLAAFEHDVRLLYRGDGVFRLLRQRNPQTLGFGDCERLMNGFEDHGISTVYALQDDLLKRGLASGDLAWPATLLDAGDMRHLMLGCDCALHLA